MTARGGTSVLIIDDEQGILDVIRMLLSNNGFVAHTAHGGRAGIEQIRALEPDIVISDIRMPDVSGTEVLSVARTVNPETPVILMTAQATLQSAMHAVNEGAFYYIQKPFRNDELLAIVHRAAEHRALRVENRTLRQEIRKRDRENSPIGQSANWLSVLDLAATVAPTDSTVLLQGESGTGKEVVARYIHEMSGRAAKPFLSVNCGALPESLLESELFGHVKGSFTGAVRDKTGLLAAAEDGTFLLDEVGEMTAATQVKLLRALQQREVLPVGATEAIPINTRVIAATNRDLERDVKTGQFRSDLYYRLNVIAIHLPPLRQRLEDIPLLAESFLQRAKAPVRTLSSEAMTALCDYDWPGNVRELENALERACIVTSGDVITAESLPERVTSKSGEHLVRDVDRLDPTLDMIERAYIKWVLEANAGNKTRAAEVLGIDPSTLHRKLQKMDGAV
ncbi:MAG: sigma-54 dependent transcriptional regulator [Gemmatimonadota bacterium]|nr:sigma-54 dependent transcriptional regulator [Gemmatimonadota bacterium]